MIRDSFAKRTRNAANIIATSVLFVLSSFWAGRLAKAQTDHPQNEGVKVLSVKSGSLAEKAGIRAGDYISDWSQGTGSGPTSSPLDFPVIERVHGPRGATILRGSRLGSATAWSLSAGRWGIDVGAAWKRSQPVLDHLNDLAAQKEFGALAEYCQVACASLDAKSGELAYGFYFAATRLAEANEMDQAVAFFGKALIASPNDNNSFEIYSTWSHRYSSISDWAAASRTVQSLLKQTEQLAPQSSATAWICLFLARMKEGEGKMQQGGTLTKRALAIGKAVAPQSYLVGLTLNELSFITAESTDDLDSDFRWLQEALPIALAIGDPDFTCLIYTNLGENAHGRGQLVSAEKYLTQGLDLATSFQVEDYITSRFLAKLGSVALDRYNLVRAENLLNRALSLNAGDDMGLEEILATLANVKSYQGDGEAAVKLLQRVLEIDERVNPHSFLMAASLTNYGLALKAQGKLKQAEEANSRGLSIAFAIGPSGSETAELRVNLADIYAAEGKWQQARRELNLAYPVLTRLERNTLPYADCLSSMAEVEQRIGQTSSALAHYQQAMSVLNLQSVYLGGTDSVRFSSKYAEIGGSFAALLLKHGDIRSAFEVLDHSRARTLVRGLAEKSLDIKSGVPAQLLAQDRELERKLADLSNQRLTALTEQHGKGISDLDHKIASTAADHELAEQRIRSASPRYAALTERSLPSLLQIQRSLESNTAILEYMAGKERSYLFVVDRNRVATFPLASREELDKLAGSVYQSWSRVRHAIEPENVAKKLSGALLGSGWDFIKRHQRLIVITEGTLQFIPFVALPIPGEDTHVLGTQFEVAHLPSASLLIALRNHPTSRNGVTDSIAVIGDPVFTNDDPRLSGKLAASPKLLTASVKRDVSDAEDDQADLSLDEEDIRGRKLTRLIHSREEAEAIASTTTPDKLFMALDFDANLHTALDSRIVHSRIVHLATHGFYDPKNPTMSGLVFSLVNKDGRQQPGFLGLDQVYRSHYSADLVVLSACETALGEDARGEGLVGLTWGFIYAGARSVVSSLWQVNDASTAELMRVFYTRIGTKGLTPAAALREAQMAIAQTPQWSAPYYWAGFTIEGEYAK